MIILITNQLHVLAALSYVDHLLLFLFSLCLLLHALDCFPSDAISNWFSTAAEDGEGVQPWIVTEDLFQIVGSVNIVDTLEWLAFLFKIFDCSLVLCC